jgi:hypothetical protein
MGSLNWSLQVNAQEERKRSVKDLGHALGLSAADTAEMEFRSELTVVLPKIIQAGRLTHAAIAKSVQAYRERR